MDGIAPQHHGFDLDADVMMEAPPLVRFDERRMHVRAYNYWASLLGDRPFPSIEDLNPEDIEDFGSHSVLLDFTGGIEDPVIAYLGTALARECGNPVVGRISEVPPRTVLSRLTDHYLQIIANQAPIGFEAEFTNQRGGEILYRGILMPFSADGDTIDFVYGVINWKEVASTDVTQSIEAAVGAMLQPAPVPASQPLWGEGVSALDLTQDMIADDDDEEENADEIAPADGLDGALTAARAAAAEALGIESRSHQALYRALGLAHGFALLARDRAEDYTALLADAGLSASARSPMTALAKLIFGADYDKTRLSEYALVIDHAVAEGIAPGALADHLAHHEGGLKAYVRAARAARRPARATPPADALARAREMLCAVHPVDMDQVSVDADGFAVVLVRRMGDGMFEAVGSLSGDDRRAAAVLKAVAADRG